MAKGEGHRTEKMYTRTGVHSTTIGVGTPHNIERKSLAVGRWVGGGWGPELSGKLHYISFQGTL